MSADQLYELRRRKEKIKLGGEPQAIERLRREGKLTARERIGPFFDPGSFVELGVFVKHRTVEFGMDKREIPAAENPEKKRQELTQEFGDRYYNPYRAAEIYHVDDVIEPWETRLRLVSALEMLKDKKRELPWKKHSNNPY